VRLFTQTQLELLGLRELVVWQLGEDVDLVAGALTVRRSSWKGQVGTPKIGRERKVPLTARLNAALTRCGVSGTVRNQRWTAAAYCDCSI